MFATTTAADQIHLGVIDEAVLDSCVNSMTGPVTITLETPATVVGTDGLIGGTGAARVQELALKVTASGCSFTIVGAMDVDIDLVAGSIAARDAPTQLFVSNVVGCFDQIVENDEVRIEGTFALVQQQV